MPVAIVTAVMIHVSDVEQGISWYEKAFPLAKRERSAMHDFEFLQLESLQLEIVPADEKVTSGPSGTVICWQVTSVADEVERLRLLGATLYRGPMRIEANLSMCQVQDPWGNCIGLRGPAA